MTDLRYEPLPPSVVYQRVTREGQFILYFIPANDESSRFEVDPALIAERQWASLPHSPVPARIA